MIKPMHIVVLVIVLLIVFGASKLPEIAKSLGQSAKVLKKEMKELQEDDTPQPLPPSQQNFSQQNYAQQDYGQQNYAQPQQPYQQQASQPPAGSQNGSTQPAPIQDTHQAGYQDPQSQPGGSTEQ